MAINPDPTQQKYAAEIAAAQAQQRQQQGPIYTPPPVQRAEATPPPPEPTSYQEAYAELMYKRELMKNGGLPALLRWQAQRAEAANTPAAAQATDQPAIPGTQNPFDLNKLKQQAAGQVAWPWKRDGGKQAL
jgi:hypothetical protein